MLSTSSGKSSKQSISFLNPERVLLFCVVWGVGLAILRSAPLIVSPYQIDYGEGLMLEGALRIRHSQPLYPNPFAFPVVLHVYGPVAYAAAASVLPNGDPSFPAGRLLILACSLGLSLLIGTVLERLTGSWWISLSFGLLLLTLPAFRFWLYLLRADVIGVVFLLAGIAVYVFHEKRWFWSVPFFSLALFSKYSLLGAPVAVFVHLILQRKRKQGLFYAAALGGACALAFATAQWKTGGWFAFHMLSTHPDRYLLMQYLTMAVLVAASAPFVTALALWYVAVDVRSRAWSFPSIYLATSTVSALTAGKLGSTTNHFVEWMVACCLCSGMAYFWVVSRYPRRLVPITALLGASILVGVIAQNRSAAQTDRDLAECGGAYRFVAGSPSSRVLSDNLGPLLVARKPILTSDPYIYGQFVKHGLWPDRQVQELLDRRYFGLIVMSLDPSKTKLRSSDVWPESLMNSIKRNYRPVNHFACRSASVLLEPGAISQDH